MSCTYCLSQLHQAPSSTASPNHHSTKLCLSVFISHQIITQPSHVVSFHTSLNHHSTKPHCQFLYLTKSSLHQTTLSVFVPHRIITPPSHVVCFHTSPNHHSTESCCLFLDLTESSLHQAMLSFFIPQHSKSTTQLEVPQEAAGCQPDWTPLAVRARRFTGL